MSECIFYQYKDGDYHCSLTNHDISDVDHVRKYCWGSCEDCPVYRSGEKADHHRGTDECIYYCMKSGDYYCQKACQYIDSGMMHSCCRNYNYRNCYIYTDSTVGDTDDNTPKTESKSTDASSRNERKPSSGNVSDASKHSTGSSASEDDYSAISVIFSILGVIFVAAWKLTKTIPFWGPYGSILMLAFTMHVGPSSGSSSGGSGSVAAVFFLAYLILHTILLFKCKKWEAKHKYWPIYVGFILLIVTLFPMWAVPAVAFQIGILIYMKQQRREQR